MHILNLASLDRARRIARLLDRELTLRGFPVRLAQCQDLYASMLGFLDWRDMLARNDPSSPHPLDEAVSPEERSARSDRQFAVLRRAGVPPFTARNALMATRPTGSLGEPSRDNGFLRSSIFSVIGPDLLKRGWDALPDVESASAAETAEGIMAIDAGTPGTNVVLRTGEAFAVAVEGAGEDCSYELQRLAARILGETPFARVGMVPDIAMLYRDPTGTAHPPKDLALRRGGRLRVVSRGLPVTLYGVHPEGNVYFQWLRKHPVRVGPDALPEVDTGAMSAFMEAAYPFL